MNQFIKKVIPLVLIMLFVFAGCAQQEKPISLPDTSAVSEATTEKTEATEPTVEETTNETTEETTDEVKELELAPEFTISDGLGGTISLADYRGKLVFVNFFTTWCKFCVEEMPDFQEAVERYPDDLAIILVDVLTDSKEISMEGVLDWYAKMNLSLPMGFDEDGALVNTYYVPAYPTTHVIDRDGNYLGYLPGAMNAEMIDQVVETYK